MESDQIAPKVKLPRSHKFRFAFVFILVPIIVLCAILIFNLITAHYITLSENSYASLENIFQEYVNDQKSLTSQPFFREKIGHAKDAGAFLNERVAWIGTSQRTPASITLAETFKKDLRQTGKETKGTWLTLKDEKFLRDIDLTWMKEVAQYDHWDIYTSGPAFEFIKARGSPSLIPVPKYEDFLDFAKVRILIGLKKKQPLEALKEVRHLATLIYSNETIDSAMIALGVLNLERLGYEEALRLKMIKNKQWEPVSRVSIETARRSIWAGSEWMSIFTPEKMFSKVTDPNMPLIGICAATLENNKTISYYRKFWEQTIWPERDYTNRFYRLHGLMESRKGDCRFTYAKKLWNENAELDVSTLKEGGFLSGLFYDLGKSIPFLRRAVGAEISYLIKTNWVSLYEKRKPVQEKEG